MIEAKFVLISKEIQRKFEKKEENNVESFVARKDLNIETTKFNMEDLDINQRYQENIFIAIKQDISRRIVHKGRDGKSKKSSEEGEVSRAATYEFNWI